MIARSARGGTPAPTRRSPEDGSSGSRATRFAPSAWPTSPPSSRRAISSWVPPDPTRRPSWVAAPCLRQNSAISELMKRAESVISRPSLQLRARPSGRSPADRRLTNCRHGRRRTACSPTAARGRRQPAGYCKRFAENRLCGAWHRALAVGRTLLLQPPPRAAIGRRERALLFGADAWPPRPRAAQPNLNPPDTTPIPTEYKAVQKTAFGVRS